MKLYKSMKLTETVQNLANFKKKNMVIIIIQVMMIGTLQQPADACSLCTYALFMYTAGKLLLLITLTSLTWYGATKLVST